MFVYYPVLKNYKYFQNFFVLWCDRELCQGLRKGLESFSFTLELKNSALLNLKKKSYFGSSLKYVGLVQCAGVDAIFSADICLWRVIADLAVTSVLVEERDDGFDVNFLDDIQSLWTLCEDAVKGLKNACRDDNLLVVCFKVRTSQL